MRASAEVKSGCSRRMTGCCSPSVSLLTRLDERVEQRRRDVVAAETRGLALFDAFDQRLGESAVVPQAALDRGFAAGRGGEGDDAAVLGRRDRVDPRVDIDQRRSCRPAGVAGVEEPHHLAGRAFQRAPDVVLRQAAAVGLVRRRVGGQEPITELLVGEPMAGEKGSSARVRGTRAWAAASAGVWRFVRARAGNAR